jgi:hypothetical protein
MMLKLPGFRSGVKFLVLDWGKYSQLYPTVDYISPSQGLRIGPLVVLLSLTLFDLLYEPLSTVRLSSLPSQCNTVFYVRYSTLLHLPPLRFQCVGGCRDRTQDCCDSGIDVVFSSFRGLVVSRK